MRRLIAVSVSSPVAAALVLGACGDSSGPTGPSGPPVVTTVNGATAPSAPLGATVVIQGSNFGTSQAAAAGVVLFTNASSGPDTATIATSGDWSGTLIVTTVPAGAVTGNLVVKTSAGASTPVTFTVAAKVAFSPSTVSWTSTTALPVGLSGQAGRHGLPRNLRRQWSRHGLEHDDRLARSGPLTRRGRLQRIGIRSRRIRHGQ